MKNALVFCVILRASVLAAVGAPVLLSDLKIKDIAGKAVSMSQYQGIVLTAAVAPALGGEAEPPNRFTPRLHS
jgi:hypothetical protein